MKKILSLLFVLTVAFAFAACGSSATTDDQGSAETSTDTGDQPAQTTEAEVKDDGVLGEYTVVLGEASVCADMDGNNTIMLYYDYTNNSADTIGPATAIYVQAFQDGVELQNAYYMDYPSEDWNTWSNNYMLDVQPGGTIRVAEGFVLNSTNPVDIEVTELISLSDNKIVKTYNIQ